MCQFFGLTPKSRFPDVNMGAVHLAMDGAVELAMQHVSLLAIQDAKEDVVLVATLIVLEHVKDIVITAAMPLVN